MTIGGCWLLTVTAAGRSVLCCFPTKPLSFTACSQFPRAPFLSPAAKKRTRFITRQTFAMPTTRAATKRTPTDPSSPEPEPPQKKNKPTTNEATEPTDSKTASGCSTTGTTNYFLLKSEPDEFSIHQLADAQREEWDGVRNYAARNTLQSMRVGDQCWFYHSSCPTPAIVGKCRIVRQAIPDVTAYQDVNHKNYDSKSTKDNCRWVSVLVEFDSMAQVPLTLKELKHQATHHNNSILANMMLLKRSRLSVMPITPAEWSELEDLMKRKVNGEDLLSSSN